MPTFWRADDRTPDEIRTPTKHRVPFPPGFNARIPLALDQAKGLIEFLGGHRQKWDWPAQATPSNVYIMGHLGPKFEPDAALKTVGQFIINGGKSGTTVHVSTGLDESCGGYNDNFAYNYRIMVPGTFWEVELRSLKCRMRRDALKTVVMVNAGTWAQATIVMIRQPPLEMTFLTGIPLSWIEAWKRKGDAAWSAMSHVPLASGVKKMDVAKRWPPR